MVAKPGCWPGPYESYDSYRIYSNYSYKPAWLEPDGSRRSECELINKCYDCCGPERKSSAVAAGADHTVEYVDS